MKKLQAEDVLEYFQTVALAEAEPILRMAIKTVADRKPLATPKQQRGPRKAKQVEFRQPGQQVVGESKSAD